MKDDKKYFSETYEVLEKLGSGSGGTVYKAYHKRLKKEVVIKRLKNQSFDISANRQEADILKNLKHTYLPQVLDFLTVDHEMYTVLSYVPGQSFKQLMDAGRRFSEKQLVYWGMQLCSALNYLHSQEPGVIHGDIKPANIMLTPEGDICLIDFNISFYLDENTALGYTEGYTSPEQYMIALDAESARSLPHYSVIDEKSDIYSLGATLYHLATGRKAASGRAPVNFALLYESVSEPFAKVIEKAMQKEPARRYGSAFEIFQALQGIGKKDRRYRRLLRFQAAVRAIWILAIAGFLMLGGYGIHTVRSGNLDEYNRVVREQTDYRKSGEYEEAEKKYEEAVELMPGALESYYQNALALFEQGEYGECIQFIDYDILGNEKVDLLSERMADVYYLKAESHYERQEYDASEEAFEQLFLYGTDESIYYRDYAIVLAENGKSLKAKEVLDDAAEGGMTEDAIYYVKGEIEKSEGSYENAAAEFRQCLQVSQDEELKARAYLMLSQMYREQGMPEAEREVLLEGTSQLPVEYQMNLLERLAQADIDLANETGSFDYRLEAIEALNQVVSQGWASYETYDSLAILYEKTGNLDSAVQILAAMTEKYGEDYNIYKRYAFLEIDRQEQKENMQRDYEAFAGYYQKAEELYRNEVKHNDTDSEMELLESLYQQVVTGGWLG